MNIIKFVSLGKYRPKLYYEKKAAYTSLLSGVLTVFFAFSFLIVVISILIDTFKRNVYDFSYVTDDLSHSDALQ